MVSFFSLLINEADNACVRLPPTALLGHARVKKNKRDRQKEKRRITAEKICQSRFDLCEKARNKSPLPRKKRKKIILINSLANWKDKQTISYKARTQNEKKTKIWEPKIACLENVAKINWNHVQAVSRRCPGHVLQMTQKTICERRLIVNRFDLGRGWHASIKERERERDST